MRKLFLSALIALSLFSCVPRMTSRIDLAASRAWQPEKFSLNTDMPSFHATGVLALWSGNSRLKADYEIHSADPGLWRIDVFGPFHAHIAAIIMKGPLAHVFYEGKWETQPWPAISSGVFGMVMPYKALSAMLGGRFDMAGECAAAPEGKVCREYDIYYLLVDGTVVEVKSDTFFLVRDGDIWRGRGADNKPFTLWPKSLTRQNEFDAKMFEPETEKDLFDEI